jgi:DNA mismatch endonuclease (patch repair protein)
MKLPGRPDVVLPKHQTIVFVHGCFWHRHKNCKDATMPKTRREWWQAKLEGNATRDRRNQAALRRSGWHVITVWECETENPEKLKSRLMKLICLAKAEFIEATGGRLLG